MPEPKNSPYRAPALLIERMWPQIQEKFVAYSVPESDADTMVEDMLVALLYKWDSISNHEFWLIRTLDNRCRRLFGEAEPKAAATSEKE